MNTPQHGRNHGEESLPSSQLKKKMFICAFENFHVSHFISNYLKTSPLPTGLQGLPDPTELSSPRSTWRPGLGLFLCLTGLCTQPTPLPEGLPQKLWCRWRGDGFTGRKEVTSGGLVHLPHRPRMSSFVGSRILATDPVFYCLKDLLRGLRPTFSHLQKRNLD